MGTGVEEFLAEILPKQLSADQAYHNGDVQPRLATWSHRDPVTLCGAVVHLKSVWDNLNQTFASLASRFAESSTAKSRCLPLAPVAISPTWSRSSTTR